MLLVEFLTVLAIVLFAVIWKVALLTSKGREVAEKIHRTIQNTNHSGAVIRWLEGPNGRQRMMSGNVLYSSGINEMYYRIRLDTGRRVWRRRKTVEAKAITDIQAKLCELEEHFGAVPTT